MIQCHHFDPFGNKVYDRYFTWCNTINLARLRVSPHASPSPPPSPSLSQSSLASASSTSSTTSDARGSSQQCRAGPQCTAEVYRDCHRQRCTTHCGLAGGCPVHIAYNNTVLQQLEDAREWRRAHGSLSGWDISPSTLKMIPSSLDPVLDPSPTPRPRRSKPGPRLSHSSSSSSHVTASLPASGRPDARLPPSHHTPSRSLPGRPLSQPPSKRARSGDTPPSPILVLDSEAEVTALLAEPEALDNGATDASTEDLKVSHGYWARNVGERAPRTPSPAAASSSSSGCSVRIKAESLSRTWYDLN